MQRDVHAAAVVESQGAVHCGFAHRAHRQWLAELGFEGRLHPRKGRGGEHAVAIEPVGEFARVGGIDGQFAVERLFGSGHLGQFCAHTGAGRGELTLFARRIHFLKEGVERQLRGDSRGYQLLRLVVRGLATLEAAVGGGDHLFALLRRKILTVESFTQKRGVLRVGDLVFGFLQLGRRNCAGFHQVAELFDAGFGARYFRFIRGLSEGTRGTHQENQGRTKTHESLF